RGTSTVGATPTVVPLIVPSARTDSRRFAMGDISCPTRSVAAAALRLYGWGNVLPSPTSRPRAADIKAVLGPVPRGEIIRLFVPRALCVPWLELKNPGTACPQ